MHSFLDPIADSPMASGPSVNMTEMTAKEPRWREESFSIQPQRLPVSFKMKPSVMAHKPRQPDMGISRVPVMVRSSNQRPNEAGTGVSASQWQVSDPGQLQPSGAMPGMGGIGADPLAPSTGLSKGGVIALGALAGCLLFMLTSKKSKRARSRQPG